MDHLDEQERMLTLMLEQLAPLFDVALIVVVLWMAFYFDSFYPFILLGLSPRAWPKGFWGREKKLSEDRSEAMRRKREYAEFLQKRNEEYFRRQREEGLRNLEKLRKAIGPTEDAIDVEARWVDDAPALPSTTPVGKT